MLLFVLPATYYLVKLLEASRRFHPGRLESLADFNLTTDVIVGFPAEDRAEPRINGPKIYGQRPGRPFLYTIPATGERPMTFAADFMGDALVASQDHNVTRRLRAAGAIVVVMALTTLSSDKAARHHNSSGNGVRFSTPFAVTRYWFSIRIPADSSGPYSPGSTVSTMPSARSPPG